MDGRGVLVALLLAGVFVLPAPVAPRPAVTYPALPRLFVSANASYAMAGDNVTFDVIAYAGGNLTDAASLPTMTLVAPRSVVANASITGLSRVGVGHYRGSIVLPRVSDRGLQSSTTANLEASTTIAGTPAVGFRALTWATPGLYLKLLTNVTTVRPVQPVLLTAELFNGSAAVDADPGSIRFFPVLGPSLGTPVVPSHPALGTYEAGMTLNLATEGGFYVNASVGGVPVHQYFLASGTTLTLPYPAFEPALYQAWVQTVRSNNSVFDGAVWVADPTGHPAAGVAVNLSTSWSTVPRSGTTDASGRFLVNLTGGFGPLSFRGTVGAGTPEAIAFLGAPASSPCTGSPWLLSSPYLTLEDPPVLPGGGLRDFLVAGTTVTRRYSFHATGISGPAYPLVDEPLNYYVFGQASGTLYAAGHGITDATGNLSLTFQAPPEDAYALFDFSIAGRTVSAAVYYSVASPSLGFQVSPLTLGGPTQIGTTFEARGSLYAASSLVWGSAGIGVLSTTQGIWQRLPSGFGCSGDFLRPDADGLNTTIFLPSFLPASGTYIVSAQTQVGPQVTEQFAILSPGESVNVPVGGSPGPTALLTWLALGAVIAAVAVLGVAVVLRHRRKGPPARPPPVS